MHQALRDATAAAHHALDHHPLLQRLTASGLTRAQYAQSLAAMAVPHVRLERWVHHSAHLAGSGLVLSAREGRLAADLQALGATMPVALTAHGTDPADTRAAWCGRLYVLEGSRLGGAVIARRLRISLGDDVPCRFFGDAIDGDAYHALLAMCEHALATDAALEQAAAAAREAFAEYHAALESFAAGHTTRPGGRRR